MKFIVSSSTLLKHLTTISGVVPSNPIVPILDNFLFEIAPEKLTVYASDLQISMITELPIESKEKGSIAVPAKFLIDTLKNLPEQPVTFTIDPDTYSIELSSDNGRYKLAGENATDFPKIQQVKNGYKADLSTDVLNSAINYTLFATSTDDLKPAMTGVYLNLGATNTTFVATDGHRLVRYRRVDIVSEDSNAIIIPRKAVSLLKTSLPSENTTVKLEFTPDNAFFSFGNVQLICRLIDERFPDYENAIPLENPNKLLIDRIELINCLRRISIYANKTTNQVRLKISGSELQVSAEDLDFSNEANERLACEYTGEDIEIGFNAKFLLEMIGNMTGVRVQIAMSAPNRAGILTPENQDKSEDLLLLIMPVILNNYV